MSLPKNLAIQSVGNLEFRLGVKKGTLRALAKIVDQQYAPFEREKPLKPFQSKGIEARKTRPIDNPLGELKALQRRILDEILSKVQLPDFLHGAVKKKTILTNAATHIGANVVVKMDIKQFFPNITCTHVYKIWRHDLGCSPRVAKLLTRLTTYKRRVPQGAPTSAALANIYLSGAMARSETWSTNSRRSAFVDDIMFSGADARSCMEPMRQVLGRDGFRLPSSKREVMGPRSSKSAPGIRIGKDSIRAPKSKISDVRAGIHKLTVGVPLPNGRIRYVESLEAKVQYIERIDPVAGRRLRCQLDIALGRLPKKQI